MKIASERTPVAPRSSRSTSPSRTMMSKMLSNDQLVTATLQTAPPNRPRLPRRRSRELANHSDVPRELMQRTVLATGVFLILQIACGSGQGDVGTGGGAGGAVGGAAASGALGTDTGGQGGARAHSAGSAGDDGSLATNSGGAGGNGGAAMCTPPKALQVASPPLGADEIGEICPGPTPDLPLLSDPSISCMPGHRCHTQVSCCGKYEPAALYQCDCSGHLLLIYGYDAPCLFSGYVCPLGAGGAGGNGETGAARGIGGAGASGDVGGTSSAGRMGGA